MVLREEHAEFVGLGRPAGAEELDAFVRRMIGIHKLVEHVVERGIQILVGGIPGLQKKIVDAGGVDGFDGGVGVGVGGQQGTLGGGEEIRGLGEEADAVEFGHALIGKEERDCVVARFEAMKRVERFVGGGGAHDAVTLGVTAAEIALDGLEHIGVVVNGEYYWLGHNRGPFGALGLFAK